MTLKKTKPRILILYTGGTFGMKSHHGQGLDLPDLKQKQLKEILETKVPEILDLAKIDYQIPFQSDSCHLQPEHWFQLADCIMSSHSKYDGVVILHGTDTLAYSAAALSMLLTPSPIPVVITGAQTPLSRTRNDARQNLLTSIELASRTHPKLINRVTVQFHDELFLGSRIRKKSSTQFSAFESPRFPRLAKIGNEIEFEPVVQQLKPIKQKRLWDSFAKDHSDRSASPLPRILMLSIHPDFQSDLFDESVLDRIDAIVLTLYSSGTAPTRDPRFLRFLERAKDCDVAVVAITEREPPSEKVWSYESAKPLQDSNVIWAKDHTPESLWTKIWILKEKHFALSKNHFIKLLKSELKRPISDECKA